jgi:hypothetical protein
MTDRPVKPSARKWTLLGFLLGCLICVILRATEIMPRPQITGNIAQQGGADIGLILAFGLIFGLIGFVVAKMKG